MTHTKRGPGKPPLCAEGVTEISLRLPTNLLKRLDATCEETGYKRSEMVRTFIQQGLDIENIAERDGDEWDRINEIIRAARKK